MIILHKYQLSNFCRIHDIGIVAVDADALLIARFPHALMAQGLPEILQRLDVL